MTRENACDAYSAKCVTVWDETRDGVEGKAVLYQDGYQSWCPTDVFLRDYRVSGNMTFELAMKAMRLRKTVTRSTWGGCGVAIMDKYLVDGQTGITHVMPQEMYLLSRPDDREIEFLNSTPWVPSTEDLMATDWAVVDLRKATVDVKS